MTLLWLEKVNWTDFFAKTAFHIQMVSEKAKTLQKGGFLSPLDQLAQFGQILTGSKSVRTNFDRVKICSNGFWPSQNLFERILTRSKSVQTEPAGWGGWKNHLYWRVFACFLSCFLLFHRQFVYGMAFLQKKSVQLTFSSHRSVIYKVPPHIGGHHFLLCQQTNTKDIAG